MFVLINLSEDRAIELDENSSNQVLNFQLNNDEFKKWLLV